MSREEWDEIPAKQIYVPLAEAVPNVAREIIEAKYYGLGTGMKWHE